MGVQAGLLAAAAFVLLVPTFNALNTAHFEDVEPPFEFEPPTPPDDPPEGDDFDLDVPVPAGLSGCSEIEVKEEEVYNQTFQFGSLAIGPSAAQGESFAFDVPPNAQAVVVGVGFREYTGDFQVTVAVTNRETKVYESPSTTADGQPRKNTFVTYEFEGAEFEPGEWRLDWSARPVTGGGVILAKYFYPACKAPAGGAAPPAREGAAA